MDKLVGKAHVYGDNIDTDRIIPGKYTKTLDLDQLANHVLEDLDPEFSKKVKKGDVLVAGENFGCGSSREQAPLALKQAGVSVVIANYFARIFFRNAINIGLPVIEVKDLEINPGDEVEVTLSTGEVVNKTTKQTFYGSKIPNVMVNILNDEGLENYLKKNKAYDVK